MSLATELKMQSLDNQIMFIKESLLEAAEDEEGAVSCRYEGVVYKETFEYFQNEDIDFKQVGESEGIPIWQFWPKDIRLSDEQREKANREKKTKTRLAFAVLRLIASCLVWAVIANLCIMLYLII